MKLIKNSDSDGTCQALTNSGKPCSRNAQKSGFCSQHFKIKKEKGLIVEAMGNEKLKKVPPPPAGLGEYGREAWSLYCEVLIEQRRLYKEYLMGLKQLAWIEEQLEKERNRSKGTGEYTSVMKSFSVEARQLRKEYGLTEESRPKIKQEIPKTPNVKNF